MYLGIEKLQSRSPTVRVVYRYINAMLAVLALGVAIQALRLRTWRARLQQARSRRLFLARSIIADALLPLTILFGLPLLMQVTRSAPFLQAWQVFALQLPDLAFTLLGVAISLLVIGIVKLVWRRGASDRTRRSYRPVWSQ